MPYCLNCRYFESSTWPKYTSFTTEGDCLRRAPVRTDDTRGGWPKTMGVLWCGEHEPLVGEVRSCYTRTQETP